MQCQTFDKVPFPSMPAAKASSSHAAQICLLIKLPPSWLKPHHKSTNTTDRKVPTRNVISQSWHAFHFIGLAWNWAQFMEACDGIELLVIDSVSPEAESQVVLELCEDQSPQSDLGEDRLQAAQDHGQILLLEDEVCRPFKKLKPTPVTSSSALSSLLSLSSCARPRIYDHLYPRFNASSSNVFLSLYGGADMWQLLGEILVGRLCS